MHAKTLPKLAKHLQSADTYTVQDTEDETRRITGVTYGEAMDYVYAMHGTYHVTNERTRTVSVYEYN